MTEVSKVARKDLLVLLSDQEGQRLDFKSKRISPAKIPNTLSAMANTDGGEIYVGIEDNREWDGFRDQEEANSLLDVVSQVFPIGDYITATFLHGDDFHGLVLKLDVSRTPDIKKSTAGDVYIRFGAQNLRKTDPESLRQLGYAKGVYSFEDEMLAFSLEDVENSEVVLTFALNIVPHPEPKVWLRKQKLVVDEKASVAAAILFADEPQTLLPKSGLKIYRYKTSDPVGTRETLAFDPLTVEGNAYRIIQQAVQLTVEKVQDVPKLGEKGLEAVLYPREAIHEIITNAVIHRDYSVNDEVHIKIFDNRIEVASPGRLPGYVTARNILQERFARNPKIVRLINKFPDPPNKDIGEGLNTAFEKMRELKLKDPMITESEAGVTVMLFHELLASPEEIIEEYLRAHSEISNSKARELCREGSENKIKRVFERMMASEIIERIPERKGRATAYRLKA